MPVDMSFLVTGGALHGRLFEAGERRAATLPPGTALGAYEILDLVGRGGTADVYRARRSTGAPEQIVALKVFCGDVALRSRALAERHILARLRHPNIARIFDAGETSDGAPWFALEFVEGEAIDAWVARRQCTLARRLDLLVQVGAALQHAHRRLVIHRDIKPSNVLVAEDDTPKLVDFGLASDGQAAGDANAPTLHTFTPAYASPEQVRGAQVGTPSDVYQFGLLVAELLLHPNAKLVLDRLTRSNVEAIVGRATRDDPDKRYPSVAVLCADLERVHAMRPVSARRWHLPDRMRYALRRHPVPALALLAIVLGALGGGAYAVHADAYYRALREHETRDAEAAQSFLLGLFRTIRAPESPGAQPPLHEPDARDASGVLGIVDFGARQATANMQSQPAARAAVVEALAEAYINLGARERALDLVRRTLDDFDARPAELLTERARLSAALVKCLGPLTDRRSFDAAIADAEHLLDAARIDPAATPRLSLGRSKVILWERESRSAAALALADTLLASAERAGLTVSAEYAGLLYERGLIRWRFALDAPGAYGDVRRAMQVQERLAGPGSAYLISMSMTLAQVMAPLGDLQGAVALLEAREREAQAQYGPDSIERYRASAALGALLSDWGGAAARERGRALLVDGYTGLHASDPRSLFTTHASYDYAQVLLDAGEARVAPQLLESARAAWLERYAPEHPLVLQTDIDLGLARCYAGQAAAGRALIAGAEQRMDLQGAVAEALRARAELRRAQCAAHAGDAYVAPAARADPRRLLPLRLRAPYARLVLRVPEAGA